ncbi:hypothetical protein CCY99_00690 [Helicobacter sp. 16-1353]|uniref:hypothetical protein n=1 Tax=Helicobacter sp. 16-1353 TaxID=2004996 RepID=UPI000DCC125B|nr:hypothetical protein [Helicobacter sp. 16-1353]RAX55249.1 hypothetical protein CCY99_00690 [Helicobacter sp. 16-1353]
MIINRRNAIKIFSSSSLMCVVPKLIADDNISNSDMFRLLSLVQEDLFPYIKELNIDSAAYLKLILAHSKVSQKTKNAIINGAKNLDKESLDMYNKHYIDLDFSNRDRLLKHISKISWGEDWIYDMLVFIMESILGDPIYGINTNENGWKWLNHHTGLPQPNKPFL